MKTKPGASVMAGEARKRDMGRNRPRITQVIREPKRHAADLSALSSWFNIFALLPKSFPPPLDPRTDQPTTAGSLTGIIPRELIRQELVMGRYASKEQIAIPSEVLKGYRLFRPTPLVRARRLEQFLRTPAAIYYKREDVSPVGSHKLNTALAQAYYAKREGVKTLITDTGAGQWGTATALACQFAGLNNIVYMTRKSYQDKPYRVALMRLFGAKVIPSPSRTTRAGRLALRQARNVSGSLGIGMSEAVERVLNDSTARLALGCMSNYAVLHQTIIGMEVKVQCAQLGRTPDLMIGCVGGGSNLAGFIYPFIKETLRGASRTEFLAVESSAIPVLSRGVYRYDFQDFMGYMPKIKMYTLGHTFVPPRIHAGGLRYHGKTPTLSYLVQQGHVRTCAYGQTEALQAGALFARTEGIVPAPETCHAVKATIDAAIRCRRQHRDKMIVMNFSGHGLLDLKAYQGLLNAQH